jgi:DHA2 family multidrug resistance protein-like MFS transporter
MGARPRRRDQTVTEASTTARAGRREWIALAVLGLPTLLVAMDFSILYLATPHLSADLAPSGVQQLWIIDIYGFLIAGFLVTMGTIGDRIGRKRLLLIGSAVFGIAGAAVTPQTLALVTGLFQDPKQLARAMALYVSTFFGGVVLGPVVGGLLLEYFWWGSVFLVSLPGIALLLLAGPKLLPEQRAPEAGRLDLFSVVLSLAAILPFVYGLKEVVRNGWEWFPVAAIVFGILVGVVFVQRQRTLEHPLLDLRLFSHRTFRSGLVVNFAAGVVGTGIWLIVTLYLQNVAGLSPAKAGLLLVIPSVLMIVGTMITPHLANHVRPAYLIALGLCVASVGYATFLLASSDSGPTTIIVAFTITMIGSAPMATLGNQLIMGAAPPDKAGSAAAIMQTANELGLAFGVALLGTLTTAVYRSSVDGSLGSVPPDAAAAARENIDRAVAASGTLPGGQGAGLLSAARDAFTSGVHAAGIAAAVGALCLAAFTVVTLRHVPKITEEPPAPEEVDASTESVSANA